MITVAIAGLGAIGMRVARALDTGEIEGMRLTAVSARDRDRAAQRVADFGSPPDIMALEDLAAHADIVVECAPKAVFQALAESVIEAGKTFMPLSVGALLDHMDLIDRARQT